MALVLSMMVLAFFFGGFSTTTLHAQYGVVLTGVTQINLFKRKESSDAAAAESLGVYETFGGASGQFSLTWLLPVDIWFPAYVATYKWALCPL